MLRPRLLGRYRRLQPNARGACRAPSDNFQGSQGEHFVREKREVLLCSNEDLILGASNR